MKVKKKGLVQSRSTTEEEEGKLEAGENRASAGIGLLHSNRVGQENPSSQETAPPFAGNIEGQVAAGKEVLTPQIGSCLPPLALPVRIVGKLSCYLALTCQGYCEVVYNQVKNHLQDSTQVLPSRRASRPSPGHWFSMGVMMTWSPTSHLRLRFPPSLLGHVVSLLSSITCSVACSSLPWE